MMFSNFKDTFIRKPQYTSTPPQALIDALEKGLPDGFTYVYDHDGYCRLDAPDGFNIESGKIVLSEDAKKALPTNPTLEDIKRYSYNSQTHIVFTPENDGCFQINGSRIKAEDIVKAPLRNVSFENIRFYMKPKPFPAPFDLTISGGGYEITLKVHRIPNGSLDTQSYESIGNGLIRIAYSIDLEQGKFTFTISTNIENATDVRDVVVSQSIYNAFMNGEGKIAGSSLIPSEMMSDKRISDETVLFWKKLYELEQFLGVSFDISNGITVGDARQAEILYRCLIEKLPYKTFKVYNSVKGKGGTRGSGYTKDENKEVYFEFNASTQSKLLGQSIDTKCIYGVFGARIKELLPVSTDENGEFEIFLTTADGKEMYESAFLFLTNDELNKFKQSKDHIKVLQDAEEIVSLE